MIRQHDLLLGLAVIGVISFSTVRNEAMSDSDPGAERRREVLEVGRVFCTATMSALDLDGDEELSLAEAGWSPERFTAADRNADGKLSRVELTIIGTESVPKDVHQAGITVQDALEAS